MALQAVKDYVAPGKRPTFWESAKAGYFIGKKTEGFIDKDKVPTGPANIGPGQRNIDKRKRSFDEAVNEVHKDFGGEGAAAISKTAMSKATEADQDEE